MLLPTYNKHNQGQSIIELIIALSLAMVILPALITNLVSSREGKAQQEQKFEAATLLQEAEEAVRTVREDNWSTFAVNGIYHPEISGNSWVLSPNQETINGYTRQIEISDVERDSNGNIVEQGGTIDPSTKKAEITVSWTTPYSSSLNSIIILSRYSGNTAYVQTTEADFSAGTQNDTTVINTGGGEITLALSGQGNWCEPNLSITALDLPKSGVANAISAVAGHVSAATGENAAGVS